MARRGSSNEIRLTRVYDAPVRAVWDAWTLPEQVAKWWGPRGFTLTTHSKDLRAGGTWRYTMHGPDGVDYPNVATYLRGRAVQEARLRPRRHRRSPAALPRDGDVHGGERQDDDGDDLHAGFARGRRRDRQAHQAGRRQRDVGSARRAPRRGPSTGKPTFVINRTFDAPIARVFEMWTSPEHLAKWLPAGRERRCAFSARRSRSAEHALRHHRPARRDARARRVPRDRAAPAHRLRRSSSSTSASASRRLPAPRPGRRRCGRRCCSREEAPDGRA
jgi:uncharacterized protein YndB with AHSA1/START domain